LAIGLALRERRSVSCVKGTVVDQHHPEGVKHALLRRPFRRDVLRALTGAGLGLWSVPRREAAAKKKRRRSVKRNTFGCVNVGDFCQTAAQCCSGICRGKPGKKKCKAHNVDVCRAGQREDACGGATVLCTVGGIFGGFCATTTGNAGYCRGGITCSACTKDAECVSACGAGAACIRCETGCPDTGGTACVGFGLCDPTP
jgi:hypothetical protein